MENGDFEAGSSAQGVGGVNSSGIEASLLLGSLANWDVSNGPSDVLATNSQLYLSLNSTQWVNSAPVGAVPGPHQNGTPNQNGLVAAFVSPTYNGYISQAVSGVVAGQVYKISFWISNQIDADSFPNNSMSAYFGGTMVTLGGPMDFTNAVQILAPTPIAVPTGWVKYEGEFTAPVNNARLTFQGGSTNSAVLVDDVTVAETPEPSALVMLGIGAALTGLRRTRRRQS